MQTIVDSVEGNQNNSTSRLDKRISFCCNSEHQLDTMSKELSTEKLPLVLGFFTQPDEYYRNGSKVNKRIGTPRFFPISDEGRVLKEGKLVDLDDSLSFLPCELGFKIVGSSNGILLICTDTTINMTYIICNPVTKQFRILPKSGSPFRKVIVAFNCSGDDATKLNKMHYEITRFKFRPFPHWTKELTVETFSSDSREWSGWRTLICPCPIFFLECCPHVVFGGLILLESLSNVLVVYDRVRNLVHLVQMPIQDRVVYNWSKHFCVSEGRIHYARSTKLVVEVWELENIEKGEWMMKHTRSMAEILKENPDFSYKEQSISINRIHPNNSQLLLIEFHCRPCWYNCQTGKVSTVGSPRIPFPYFPYDWPCNP